MDASAMYIGPIGLGDVLSVPKGLIRHKGLYAGDDRVLHAYPRRGVVLDSLADFCRGRDLRNEGYPGTLPRDEVIARGMALLGTPYSVFDANCEHLIAEAHGLDRASPQLAGWAVAGAAAALGLAALFAAGRRSA